MTVTDVFCNNCGHRNPTGSNFCSSCGAILEVEAPEHTTITFHPTLPSDPVDHEVVVELGEDLAERALLIVKRGPNAGTRFSLEAALVTVGRHPESDIFLDDITVSRRHVELHWNGETYELRDVGSLNGSYVNRERVDVAALENGDELQIGKFKLVYFIGSSGA